MNAPIGHQLHINGIRQHYLHYPSHSFDKDTIILIPGITSPAITWDFVARKLARHFDTYTIDVRGRGLSEAGPNIDYSLDAQAGDVVALAQSLGLQRFTLIGHSMGARIAIRVAKNSPSELTKVVLIDPPVSGPGRRPYPVPLEWFIEALAQARQGLRPEDLRKQYPNWTEEQLRIRAEWLHTCDERAVIENFSGFHHDDIHNDLRLLTIPLLLMTAERGDVVLNEDIEELRRLNPQINHVQVADSGHMIPWDNETGFYAALGNFLGLTLSFD